MFCFLINILGIDGKESLYVLALRSSPRSLELLFPLPTLVYGARTVHVVLV